ncbi:hypothetical protein BDQ17DRAFT_1381525, partial [Cyathus striatus]
MCLERLGSRRPLGTVNLLTEEVVKRAAQEEIQTGTSVCLNWYVLCLNKYVVT